MSFELEDDVKVNCACKPCSLYNRCSRKGQIKVITESVSTKIYGVYVKVLIKGGYACICCDNKEDEIELVK
jgi:hypothetical protein